MDIKEILDGSRPMADVITDLKKKSVVVPSWGTLVKEYNPKKHAIMDDPDFAEKNGKKQTRINIGAQKLAVKRMTQLLFSIKAQRVYSPDTDEEKYVADVMEDIFTRNRIDSVNYERSKNLYASCENVTLWYLQETKVRYGEYDSPLKVRCRNFSPKQGHTIYPLFDEFDDLVALSVEYLRKEGDVQTTYFETFTSDEHIRWRMNAATPIEEELREEIKIGKIPGIYVWREEPIWEDQTSNISEAEYALSRNGNYIRKNARPTFLIFSDNKVTSQKEPDDQSVGRNILRFGKDDDARYATWEGSTDAIKYHVSEILRQFYIQLQLPDLSMDNMKTTQMSGESRKMLFIDAQMKAEEESGIWIEAFDREVNVIRAILHLILPDNYSSAIDSLKVESVITPYQIQDETEKIGNLAKATGNGKLMSRKTAVKYLGYADDVDEELKLIDEEESAGIADAFLAD